MASQPTPLTSPPPRNKGLIAGLIKVNQGLIRPLIRLRLENRRCQVAQKIFCLGNLAGFLAFRIFMLIKTCLGKL